eukprot:TRINITY_DN5597_c0_g1_i4.p1 TRINITY_DN5597_c0_g1~~TRINITY_DN5597_c0_g1_i4.p1  ORF type:complete len:702 (+),score=83.00 TRINITY_DN5597_c0_g1_i4:246-2351(+)
MIATAKSFSDMAFARQLQAAVRRNQLSRRCTKAVHMILGLILVILTGWLFLRCTRSFWHMLITQLALVINAVVFILRAWTPTGVFHACFAALVWGRGYLSILARLELNPGVETRQSELFTTFSWCVAFVYTHVFLEIVAHQLRKEYLERIRKHMVPWVKRAVFSARISLSLLLVALVLDEQTMQSWSGFEVLLYIFPYVWLMGHTSLAFVVILSIQQLRCRLREIISSLSSSQAAEAQDFVTLSRVFLFFNVFAFVVSGAAFFFFFFCRGWLWPLAWKGTDSGDLFWIASVDSLVHAFFSFEFSGGFRGVPCAERKSRKAEKERYRHWYEASVVWRPHDHEGWQAKVEDLADRGITLESLLDFYKSLGAAHMQHYVPGLHRTLDVVRMAIIPASRDTNSALAPVMMHGARTRPDAMVTHSWNNLFRDLVAAVVADALCEDEFEMIGYLLEHDFKSVEEEVRRARAQKKTYWICAFAVNQHAGICSDNPQGTRDLVANKLHPVCSCDVPKVWNHTEPTLNDGRAIDCELNKFDDMMRFLSARNPDFRQVIAVDASFDLFSRAWCVAEIAAANGAWMRQNLKIKSQAVLSVHKPHLKHLRVQNMSASRPEDVQQILASIPDKAFFNRRLQELVFDELFPAWNELQNKMVLKRMVGLLRWQNICDDGVCLHSGWDAAARGLAREDEVVSWKSSIGRPQGLDVAV